MLQQTQVNTAIDYFNKFMGKFPDLKSIKGAQEDEIYGLWSGLGYYRRASYIFKAKEIIHKDFHGQMPDDFDSLLSLPGIGRSTAGAILSIAFKKPYPILDANVKKVVARIFHKKKSKKLVKAKEKEIKGQLGKKAETAREKMIRKNAAGNETPMAVKPAGSAAAA